MSDFAHTLGLSQDEATKIEIKALGDSKERMFTHRQAIERYTLEVRTAWKEGWLSEQKVARLKRVASQLPLGQDDLARIERSVMGSPKEELLKHE